MKHNAALYNKHKNIVQIVGSEIYVQHNFLTVHLCSNVRTHVLASQEGTF
jgi:hypothetical protein